MAIDWNKIAKDLLLNGIVKNLVVKAIVGQIVKAIPFLAWGPLPMLLSTGISWVLGKGFDHLDLYLDLKSIAFKQAEHRAAYAKAAAEMYNVAKEHGMDSEEYKKARQRESDALFDFIEFNGGTA